MEDEAIQNFLRGLTGSIFLVILDSQMRILGPKAKLHWSALLPVFLGNMQLYTLTRPCGYSLSVPAHDMLNGMLAHIVRFIFMYLTCLPDHIIYNLSKESPPYPLGLALIRYPINTSW